MRRKLEVLMAIFFFMGLFTACGSLKIETRVENLMRPPKMSEEQVEIYKILETSMDGAISLKYPRSGSNRSAFIFELLDPDDNSKEVLAFYEADMMNEGTDIRVALLDKRDGKWELVQSKPAPEKSRDIISVEFIRISSNYVSVVIAYDTSEDNNKLVFYSYRDGKFGEDFSMDYLAYKAFTDTQATTPRDRLAVVSAEWGRKDARLQIVSENAQHNLSIVTSEYIMGSATDNYYITSYVQSKPVEETHLYIDTFQTESEIFTQLFFLKDDKLSEVLTEEKVFSGDMSSRNRPILTTDLEGIYHLYTEDGEELNRRDLEVPVQDIEQEIAQIQYLENSGNDISLYYWYGIREHIFVKKYAAVYNNRHEYFVVLPRDEVGKISVRMSQSEEELVFYHDLEDGEEELLRIWAIPRAQENNIYIPPGYEYIIHNEQYVFYEKRAEDSTGQFTILPWDEDETVAKLEGY